VRSLHAQLGSRCVHSAQCPLSQLLILSTPMVSEVLALVPLNAYVLTDAIVLLLRSRGSFLMYEP